MNLLALPSVTSVTLPRFVLEELAARYAEPHRRYHDAAHIHACFAARAAITDAPSAIVDLALLFHDAVYQPLAGDNEERSAALLVELGRRAALDQATLARAASLILLTRHDAAAAQDAGDRGGDDGSDAAVVLDADLSILGADAAAFARYERSVRAEYSVVPDEAYARGRGHVLHSLAARPRLYRTGAGRDLWEAAAHANLGRSLSLLCPPS